MEKILNWVNTLLLVGVLVVVLVGGNNQSDLLGGGTRFPNGLSADSTSPVAGEVRGTTATFTGAITTGGVTIGSSGTAISEANVGTCYVLAYATTIAASTTAQVDCQGTAAINLTNTTNATALTGVASGDFVLAQLSTTSSKFSGTALVGWGSVDIVGVSASSTSGYISLIVQNNTGTTFTWPTVPGVGGVTATGTVNYFIAD